MITAAAGGLGGLLRGAADLLLPSVCAGCGTEDAAEKLFCATCNVEVLSLVSLPYCPRCGATVGPNLPVREDGCWSCPDPLPRFARVVRLGPYTDPLRTAIRDLKYRRRETVLRELAAMLAQAVLSQCPEDRFDLVLPVPMHWRRRIGRGYDHSRALGRALSRRLGLPVGDELVRVRNTPPQVHLPRSRRIENVRGAFAVHRKSAITGANILLADDVTTTGATANEAARTLLKAGADKVTLTVVAKAESPRAYSSHWQL